MGEGTLGGGGGRGHREASFSQERLWFMEKLVQGTCVFNMLNGFRVKGGIDREAFRRSVLEIVRRHEVLRTNLIFSEGKVWQSVSPVSDGAVEFVDLSGLPEGERLGEARRRALGWAKRPYDLSRDLLFRAVLIKINHEEHLVALLAHHSVFDGWSSRIFASELAAIYSSLVEGKPTPLPEPSSQYGDFAVLQRRRMEGGEYDGEWEYWRGRLGDRPPVLELQTDRPRRGDRTYRGGMVTVMVPGGLRDRLKGLGIRNGCTLYMTLLAAFYVYLFRYSGNRDLVVGCPIAGRGAKELEGLMGFFINTLPIRAELSGDETFVSLLRKVRRLCIDAYKNQNIPFDKVVERLSPERDLSHSPVFQVLFQLRNYPEGEMSGSRMSLEPFEFGWVTAQVDLTIDAMEVDGGIRCELEYPSELFEARSAERMAGHWLKLLEGIADDPGQAVSRLPLMGDEEFRRLVFERNSTGTDYPREKCIHQLFEERVAENPDAVAVTHGGSHITYGELNGQANQLAAHIRGLGLGKGGLVGVCLDRSIGMVGAFLAILKAGGGYVPLDPDYPLPRMRSIVGGLSQGMVVTCSKYEGKLPPEAMAVNIERDAGRVARCSKENAPNRAEPGGIAHVIYTSGSLGSPKGVCCSHRGVVRVSMKTNYIDLGPGDTVVHASSPIFDATTFEVFGPLLNGARILIVEKDLLLSGREFADLLREEKATAMFVTTALFNLKARDAPGTFASLKTVMFGGETVDPSSVKMVLAAGAPKRLLHMYGPTENTVFSTYHDVKEVPEGAVTIPIGGNISNSTSYVLDKDLQPVPTGVKGEICVSGDGVALGYLNQPDLTQSAFVPNPFEPGRTLYRTGDLGKFLSDGSIEFLGREDLQVKIRGFRIELGEVEAALSSHSAVKAAAVVAKEGKAGGGKRLVAYVVPDKGKAVGAEDIRAHVRRQLPEYMVPSRYVLLEQLPMTATGKIDRRSLPEELVEEEGCLEAEAGTVEDVEARLASIWARLLGVGRVGLDDNFFEIGGNSLLSVRLFSRIEDEFKTRLPIATLFRAPTVAQLAAEIRRAGPRAASLVPLRAEGSRPTLFLVHAQDGEVVNYGHLVEALGEDQPVYGLRAAGLQDDAPLPKSVEEAASKYVGELRYLKPHGPYHLAGWCLGGLMAFEMAQQLWGEGQEVGMVAILDDEAPYPGKYDSRRWGRAILLRETLSLTLDLLRYSKKRGLGSLEIPSRLVLLERLWLRFFGIAPFDGIVVPGEARQLPKTWKKAILNLSVIAKNYLPKRYGGIVTVFRKENLPTISSGEATDGWGEFAAGGIVVVPIKGRIHGDMLKPPAVSATASMIRERMDWHERLLGRKDQRP